MNKTKLREMMSMYLDDIEHYGDEKELHIATDVLFDFFKYVEALDFEGETIETVELQNELIKLLEGQITDLTLMSKIELGDDVISKVMTIKNQIKNKQGSVNRMNNNPGTI